MLNLQSLQWRSSSPYWPTWSLIHCSQSKTRSFQPRCQTRLSHTVPANQILRAAIAGMETCLWSATHRLDAPDLSWHSGVSQRLRSCSWRRMDHSGGRSQRREVLDERFASRWWWWWSKPSGWIFISSVEHLEPTRILCQQAVVNNMWHSLIACLLPHAQNASSCMPQSCRVAA